MAWKRVSALEISDLAQKIEAGALEILTSGSFDVVYSYNPPFLNEPTPKGYSQADVDEYFVLSDGLWYIELGDGIFVWKKSKLPWIIGGSVAGAAVLGGIIYSVRG